MASLTSCLTLHLVSLTLCVTLPLVSDFMCHPTRVINDFMCQTPVVLSDSRQARMRRLYPRAIAKAAIRTVMMPMPERGGQVLGTAEALENEEILEFVSRVIDQLFIG